MRKIVVLFQILLLGAIQTVIESVMYIFVFLWTPVLMPAEPPLGMAFACFMVAIMIGSSIYPLLLSRGFHAHDVLKMILVILTAAMVICCLAAGPNRGPLELVILYFSFLALEVSFGMYFPTMSYLKSQIIPEGHRANVMNWFRVPMNLITCTALLSLHSESLAQDKRIMFLFCLLLCVLGFISLRSFRKATDRKIIDVGDKLEGATLLNNDDSDDTS